MHLSRPRVVSVFISLLVLSCIPATAQRLNVSPNFVFFTQDGSTPPPATVKVTALASAATPGTLGAFTTSAKTLSGGSWLSVSPTSGAGPSALTITANTGGMAPGEYAGTVSITAVGFANSPYDLGVSLTILAPALTVRPSALSFSAVSGAAAPEGQSLMVSLLGGGAFSWTASAVVTTPANGTWLKISSTAGTNASTLTVSVDPTDLTAGTYQGQIEVSSPRNGVTSTLKVPVTLTVLAPKPPVLQVSPTSLDLVYDPSGATPLVIPTIQVTNSGSGTIDWTAKATVETPTGGTWLSISPASGTTPGTIVPSASYTGLSSGTYSGTITVTGAGAASPALSAQVRVTFTVRPPAAPVVAVTPGAIAFNFADSVLTPASSAISVTSSSSGLAFTASASTAKGGNWLTVSPSSGTVTSSSSVTAGVSNSVGASLPAGIYTGTITIKVPGAAKNTFSVLASLQVFPSGQTPFFQLNPGALLFSSEPGTTTTSSETVSLEAVGSTTLAWSTNLTTDPTGGSWLSVSPSSGAGSATVKVAVNSAGLAPGRYSGSVTFNAASGSASKPVTLQVQLIIGEPAQPFELTRSLDPSVATMSTAAPQALITSPADGFASAEDLPLEVSVKVVDSQGKAIDGAAVTVRSSNGEPDLTLEAVGDGLYTGLFQPLAGGPVVLTVKASSGIRVSAPNAVSGDVQPRLRQ